MTQKHVTTVRLADRQLASLKAEAERLDISFGELIRLIVDKYLEGKDR